MEKDLLILVQEYKKKNTLKLLKPTTLVREMFQGWINYGDYLIGHLLTTFANVKKNI